MGLTGGTLDVRAGESKTLMRGHAGAALPPSLRRAIDELGIEDPDVDERQTYTEWVVEPGDSVYVLGSGDDDVVSRVENTRWNAFVLSDTPRWSTLLTLGKGVVAGTLGAVVLGGVVVGLALAVLSGDAGATLP